MSWFWHQLTGILKQTKTLSHSFLKWHLTWELAPNAVYLDEPQAKSWGPEHQLEEAVCPKIWMWVESRHWPWPTVQVSRWGHYFPTARPRVIMGEHNVQLEESTEAAYERKMEKYWDLSAVCTEARWKVTTCLVEVSCRGSEKIQSTILEGHQDYWSPAEEAERGLSGFGSEWTTQSGIRKEGQPQGVVGDVPTAAPPAGEVLRSKGQILGGS